jgi:hypothetical protein
VYVEYNFYLD